jgi:hypothetical protein
LGKVRSKSGGFQTVPAANEEGTAELDTVTQQKDNKEKGSN